MMSCRKPVTKHTMILDVVTFSHAETLMSWFLLMTDANMRLQQHQADMIYPWPIIGHYIRNAIMQIPGSRTTKNAKIGCGVEDTSSMRPTQWQVSLHVVSCLCGCCCGFVDVGIFTAHALGCCGCVSRVVPRSHKAPHP